MPPSLIICVHVGVTRLIYSVRGLCTLLEHVFMSWDKMQLIFCVKKVKFLLCKIPSGYSLLCKTSCGDNIKTFFTKILHVSYFIPITALLLLWKMLLGVRNPMSLFVYLGRSVGGGGTHATCRLRTTHGLFQAHTKVQVLIASRIQS